MEAALVGGLGNNPLPVLKYYGRASVPVALEFVEPLRDGSLGAQRGDIGLERGNLGIALAQLPAQGFGERVKRLGAAVCWRPRPSRRAEMLAQPRIVDGASKRVSCESAFT